MKRFLVIMPLALGILAAGLWAWLARPPPLHEASAAFGARKPGIELGAGFVSYVDAASVRAVYADTQVINDIRRTATPAHPPRALLTLALRPFTHLDVPGWLTLDFFNDRLMEVTFYPQDPKAYAPALSRAEPGLRRQGANRQVGVSGHRRVAANIAQQASPLGPRMGARPFVLWQDLRLRAELDDWDARFGHLPQPADPR
jgi:hypothetical protein